MAGGVPCHPYHQALGPTKTYMVGARLAFTLPPNPTFLVDPQKSPFGDTLLEPDIT